MASIADFIMPKSFPETAVMAQCAERELNQQPLHHFTLFRIKDRGCHDCPQLVGGGAFGPA
ncbi:hypothetical protein FJQ54_01785 [Sandaracinobacter neustonicus]|uniref:Uncharacterized protein n=1 Tax=Sandaracinobacter neustonicus TaxID=1715348 RepID=A0A501XSI0_9SPHN|nr:hypothetical protein [Sandaracinobacter neustonicus]TPE63621.1 hypothetical protein FJQ54_01785 [Sandaracinobacter neustonicus]